MKRCLGILICCVLTLCISGLGLGKSASAGTAIDDSKIDSYIEGEMKSRRIPGAAVAIVENGKIVYERVFGIANLETDAPVKINSIFELASITKQFTAAAIMMLVEEGKVNLDDPVNKYIDATPGSWKAMTVRNLLNHTAGLGGAVVMCDGSPLILATTKQQFDFIAKTRPIFPPGEGAFYSDAGYVLLGMVIERASGLSYREFMQKRIFDPLKMTETSILDKLRVLKNRVSTYEIRKGNLTHWGRDWHYEMPSFFGIFSTIEDLVKWDSSLRNMTLLKKSSLDEMWTPGKLNNGQDAMVQGGTYGFGWQIADIRGHKIVEHGGASGTFIIRFLDSELTIIVLTNLDVVPVGTASYVAHGIASRLKPEYQTPQMLTPQADPSAETTTQIRSMLADIAEGHESKLMTASHQSYYNLLPPMVRQNVAQQLGSLKSFTYIAQDDVEGRGLRITEPITRICYYKGQMDGKDFYFTFWLTKEGKVAHLRFSQ